MLKKLILTLLMGASASLAIAAETPSPAAEATVRAAVLKLAPGLQIDQIGPAPLAGFYQVIASGQLVYVSSDGKYMLNGSLVDLAAKKDLADTAWAGFRKAELAKVPVAQRIVYAPANPLHTVTVFSDVTCGYCKELHKHIADLNKAGIAVQYLAWPREGVTDEAGRDTATYTEMVSVWCASDRNKAFDDAMNGRAPKPATCANPVRDQFKLGVRLGVSGTPSVMAEDGTMIGGYLSPEQMRTKLDQLSAKPAGKTG
ncbi:MAG: thioredoxin fold domain-containing protein [Dyella sp.]